jgi:low temperature requirement protein LtrA
MIVGIVLFAVGVKKTLGDVGEPLKLVPAVTLCGGIALYLLAHILFRLRNVGTLNRQRLVVTAVLLALIPLAVEISSLVTLTLVALLCVGLIAYEAIRFAEARDRVRHAAEPAG